MCLFTKKVCLIYRSVCSRLVELETLTGLHLGDVYEVIF